MHLKSKHVSAVLLTYGNIHVENHMIYKQSSMGKN